VSCFFISSFGTSISCPLISSPFVNEWLLIMIWDGPFLFVLTGSAPTPLPRLATVRLDVDSYTEVLPIRVVLRTL
jgi:hypothetical protein